MTSPPYATRIDYVVGMLPELAVLKCNVAEIRSLRAAMVGTPAISQSTLPRAHAKLGSDYGRQLTAQIFQHASKGSRSYYGPWLRNYFLGLQLGLRELARTVVPGGPVCVVVQDSFYKDIHLDLQRFVIETFATYDRRMSERDNFPVKHLLSQANPKARRYLQYRSNSESVLLFR